MLLRCLSSRQNWIGLDQTGLDQTGLDETGLGEMGLGETDENPNILRADRRTVRLSAVFLVL